MATATHLKLSIRELAPRIESGQLSPVQLVEDSLNRIAELNPQLNAYITVMREKALTYAEKSEKLLKKSVYLGPLQGIPIGIKDNIYVGGVRCTAGSKIMYDYIADYDATAILKLKQAGAIIVGKTNTHEFASGVTNVNPHFGPSRNPWDKTRMSGGSSGGSAVSVSALMSCGALGTETTGSIRIPSSLCGVVGLKPTYGRVSRHGVFPLASSMDTVGAIARSAWDAAAILQAISGRDPKDNTTSDSEVPDYLKEIEKDPSSIRIGIPKEYFFDVLHPEVKKVFSRFLDRLVASGIQISQVRLDDTDKIQDIWYPIRYGEPAAVHYEWFKTRQQDYGEDVRKMLQKGLQVPAVEYIRALEKREEILRAFLRALGQAEVMIVPTTAIPAPKIEDRIVEIGSEKLEVYIALGRLTLATSVVGLPGINVPIGFTKDDLPIGAQIIASPFREDLILRMAYHIEKTLDKSESFIPNL